jgi:large subunit ribosomal protein L5
MSEKDTKKGKAPVAKGGKSAGQGGGGAEGKKPKGKQGEGRSQAAAEVLDERPSGPKEPARLQTFYRETVMENLAREFGYKSRMEVPRVDKIVVNMGVGEAVADKKIMDNAVADLQKITGQKPLVTNARKSVANFKIREGYPVGAKVTLRGARMYEFLDRLVNVALPRVRDFRGISARSFDGRGNYNMGVKEQIIFPEIEYDKIDAIRGMNITITTTAKSDAEAKALLAAFKFPFRS